MIKRFIKYYRPHMTLFIWDMVCALALAVCDLFYPVITKNMLEDYIPGGKMRLLIIWAVILLGIYAVKMALNHFVNYWGHIVGVRMQSDMRRDVFAHLQ
ncbi:MAG: ABC transporter ATP-binding protein, partial [Clostridia bacterium]|nr:ABC transporter ATP-binding protein [Clostridia bacterium]